MSKDNDEYAVREIVIVRRIRENSDDHGHGAVWKIAYADFMTAMMAFFLVMWLINAANEETKQAVASYFNPLKLMDVTSNPKGVFDPKVGASRHADSEPPESVVVEAEAGEHTANVDESSANADAGLFRDPYAVLAAIAGEEGSGSGSKAAHEEMASVNVGAETNLDPLDPNYWKSQSDVPGDATMDEPGNANEKPAPETSASNNDANSSSAKSKTLTDAVDAALKGEDRKPEIGSVESVESKEPNAHQLAVKQDVAQALRDRISAALREAEISDKDPVSVEVVDEGVLVSVTEKLNFEMFEVGSARPRKDLVLALGSIGAALLASKGDIIVRGHTDGRAYRSGEYDNWRLSAARAQMAYHMLVRGGLPEERVKRIEGHADRKLSNQNDPLSASNRRIEILVIP